MAAKLCLRLSAVVVLALGLTVLNCEATVFTVGDSPGWDVSADLQSWVASKIFDVGDVLLFQYSTYLSVNEVRKPGYNTCSASDAILTGTGGNTTVTLTTAGNKYFISGNPLYCYGGMKLQVNVQGNGTAPAASPETTPDGSPADPSAENNNLSPFLTSGGFVIGSGRGSVIGAWLCTLGVLLWGIV